MALISASTLQGVASKMNILHAIILREVRVRYASRRLGYAWAVLEPLIHIGVYVVLFTVMGRMSPIDQPITIFFGSSILPWMLFTGTIGRVAYSPEANKALLVYPHIFPIDFMIGRMVLEFATCITVTAILMVIAHVVYGYYPEDPFKMLLSGVVILFLAGGVGMINAIMMTYTETYDNFFKPVLRLIYFTSGIFFVVGNMPSMAQEALAWNPMLHLIDWFRVGAIPNYRSDFYQPLPVTITALAIFVLGMMLERIRRKELRTP